MRRRVAILGSTGSIGTQALDVIGRHHDRFEVVALAAGTRAADLAEQVRRFAVPLASLAHEADARALAAAVDATVLHGAAGLHAAATESRADIVLAATDGAVAFEAVFAAVALGIDIAVANKELIVAAGELLLEAAARSGSRILPVDSEHSALFQCLQGEDPRSVSRLILTASGGPFRATPLDELERVTVAEALRHPTWSMGVKNSVDSATMMNKGLEVIEASKLFGIPGDRIDVLIHPTSIVHGFVVFSDGSGKAQLAAPDMRLPIGYALAYPERLPLAALSADPLELAGAPNGAAQLEYAFERVDFARFPSLGLAYRALREGGTSPAVLSAANEIAVAAFCKEEITFREMHRVVAETMDVLGSQQATLPTLAQADRQARSIALERCAQRK